MLTTWPVRLSITYAWSARPSGSAAPVSLSSVSAKTITVPSAVSTAASGRPSPV